jgi:hypothetical protein
MSEHRDTSNTRFKWLVIASLIALVLILGTIQELAK